MIDQVIVLENVVTTDIQEIIKHELFETMFPWFYKSTLSQNTQAVKGFDPAMAPGFGHVFYNDYGKISNFHDTAFPVVQTACDKIGFRINEMMYGRTFLQMPLTTNKGVTNPHVDILGIDHLVCVYYVVDSDGDTVIFDKKHTKNILENDKFDDVKIIQRITPRQGTALLFNGNRYHANILPQEHLRCIINFNVR